MKINSFFVKLFLSFFITIFTISSVFFIATNRYIKKQNKQFFIEELSINKDVALQALSPFFQNENFEKLNSFVGSLAKTMRRRITITDIDGNVIADSDKNAAEMQNHMNRTEIKSALQGKTAYDIRYSSTLNQEMLYFACPVKKNSATVAVLRLSMPVNTVNVFSKEMSRNIFLIISISFFIVLLISYFFAKKIARKITKLEIASQKMATGDFSVKIFSNSAGDEFDRLGRSFNTMSEKIENLFSEIKDQKDKLDKIISSIDDTIILLDKSGIILLHNNAFMKHFRNINPDGKHYWEIFKDPGIESAVKGLSSESEVITKEIKENEKYFLFTASGVAAGDNTVLTFHDITAMKQMELLKKEFVTNASHELKTPLTAINGFIETMENENDLSNIKHYMSIIKRHSVRLSKIVADLLSLSEMENNKNMELHPLSLDKLIADVIPLFNNKITEKNLSLDFIKEDGQKYDILGNEFYIEQMIINLIENAIRYTEKGLITVKLTKERNKVVLIISDTGIGIAKEHLPRIFERFYVADKARSRKNGGTGLGLSIVKYIVSNHNASIQTDSREGVGTTFTIKFQ